MKYLVILSMLLLGACQTTGSSPYSNYGSGYVQHLTPGEESNSSIAKACTANHAIGLAIFGAIAGAALSDDPAIGAAAGLALGNSAGSYLDNNSCNSARKAAKAAMENAGTKYSWHTGKSNGYSVVNTQTKQRKDVIWVNGVEKVSYVSVQCYASGRCKSTT